MGIWIELGVFVLALAWGVWQLQDLKKERRKREQRQREEAARPAGTPEGDPPA